MALILNIKVVPGSGKQALVYYNEKTLKCYLKNQAKQGKANDELIRFFAKSLNIPQKNVEIIAGGSIKYKRVKIDIDCTMERLFFIMGIDRQLNLFKKIK